MKLLLTTVRGLEEVASLEARRSGLRLISVVEPSLLIAEGDAETALRLRTIDSVSEVLCSARAELHTPKSLRSVLRECFREAREKGLASELRMKAWVRVRGVSRRMLELIAAREAERVLKVEASPRARSIVRIYLCADGVLLVARQINAEPLHLRHYYIFKHPHALNPLLAAAIPILAPAESMYDPCCGSGGMLILSYYYVVEKYGKDEARKLFLYGQERNPTIYAICQMNLFLHDIRDANLECGDTLDYPRFRENGKLKQFNIVIANPPWNQDGYNEDRLKRADFRERFRFGYTPKNTADWAWIQHMLASAKEDGRVGIVIDNGCLFREGREKIIRSRIIERDWIECIILLPEKLFYNTGAPGTIIIFSKNKPPERKGKILFINASNEYIPHPSVRRLNSLSNENIKKIVDVYRKFADMPGFSRVVSMKEIKDNDYNLNVTLYVMPIEEEEPIDIAIEFSELKKLEMERQEVEKKLEEYISQLTQVLGTGDDE